MNRSLDLHEGDVFRFSYSTEYRAKLFMPDHCFDGQLVALDYCESIILFDTYWLHGFKPSEGGAQFTQEEALARGELTFVCNLNDVEMIDKGRAQYYDDADIFNLSYQHQCSPYFAIRKGAERSQAKMSRKIEEKMQEERRSIESAISRIGLLTRAKLLTEEGRLSEVYL